MHRLAAALLILLWISPLEAGLFRRKPTAAQQMKERQRKNRAQYGAEAFRKQVKEGRSGKLKPPQVRAKVSESR